MEKHYFYIPLVECKINLDRLKKEIFEVVKPKVEHGNYCLTCTEEDKQDENYNFRKYSGSSVYDPEKQSRFHKETGKYDFEIIYWPKGLENSYISVIGQGLTKYLGFKNQPRCRLSVTKKVSGALGMHHDLGTPYRVHIAVLTNPEIKWIFKDELKESSVVLHQPANGIPVLINTADVPHDTRVPDHTRLHLWYQWVENIDSAVIKKVLSK